MIKKDKKLKSLLLKSQEAQKQSKIQAQQISSIINPVNQVQVEVEDDRPLLRYSQEEIKEHVPIANAQNMFELDLRFGPYSMSITPTHVYLGGSRGHIVLFNWRNKHLECEFNVKEKVRDIHWVAHNNFSIAQDKSVFMYDTSGTELHKIREHKQPQFLEYLPYHFLLASLNESGKLLYQDITQGSIVNTYQSVHHPRCMIQNPANAVLSIGDSMGVVRMYTPNQATPVMSMLCQKSSVSGLGFSREGQYMVTGGGEGCAKVWDLRMCKQLGKDILLPQPVSRVAISEKNIVALSCGAQALLYKDLFQLEQIHKPYMRHRCNSLIGAMEFIDHEDYLSMTTNDKYIQLLVPESGNPKLDTYESWHMQTKKQQGESNVRALLEKLPSTSITLNPALIGSIDKASKDVIKSEIRVENQVKEEKRLKSLKKKNKMRGRSSAKNKYLLKEQQVNQEQQVKWQEALGDGMRVRKAEKIKRKHEQNLLQQLDSLSASQFLKVVTKKDKKKIQ